MHAVRTQCKNFPIGSGLCRLFQNLTSWPHPRGKHIPGPSRCSKALPGQSPPPPPCTVTSAFVVPHGARPPACSPDTAPPRPPWHALPHRAERPPSPPPGSDAAAPLPRRHGLRHCPPAVPPHRPAQSPSTTTWTNGTGFEQLPPSARSTLLVRATGGLRAGRPPDPPDAPPEATGTDATAAAAPTAREAALDARATDAADADARAAPPAGPLPDSCARQPALAAAVRRYRGSPKNASLVWSFAKYHRQPKGKTSASGGLGDRLRGVMYTLFVALATDRAFGIDFGDDPIVQHLEPADHLGRPWQAVGARAAERRAAGTDYYYENWKHETRPSQVRARAWPPAGASLRDESFFFFLLRTALKDRPQGPPTATANSHQLPTATNRQPPTATNRQPPTAANRQRRPTANCQPLPTASNHQPPATNRRHTTTNRHQPPVANCQPPTAANRQPPTATNHG